MNDTLKEPVETDESIEDAISLAIDGAEEIADEDLEQSKEPEDTKEPEEAESDDSVGADQDEAGEDTERASADEDEGADTDQVAAADEDADDAIESPSDKLTAPEHWSAVDKEKFNNVPVEAQEFVLERHKAMEGDYTRKSQDNASIIRQYESIQDALAPFESEFSRAGLDNAGAVRQLAHWHTALKTSPQEAIQELARTYGVDLQQPEIEDDFTDPAMRNIQTQLNSLQGNLTRQEQAAQQREHKNLLASIQTFEAETDATGSLLHPHFKTLEDDITRLFQARIATDLEDGYTKALAMRPDLAAAVKPASITPKVDEAKAVSKAKKAATGIKSSGAVGKRERGELTLQEEIASHF